MTGGREILRVGDHSGIDSKADSFHFHTRKAETGNARQSDFGEIALKTIVLTLFLLWVDAFER